jgi:hypothetical protein
VIQREIFLTDVCCLESAMTRLGILNDDLRKSRKINSLIKNLYRSDGTL